MKLIGAMFALFVGVLPLHSQGIEIAGGDEGVFQPQAAIKPGTFGDPTFTIVLTAAQNGAFSVAGQRIESGATRRIVGNMTKAGVLRARMRMGGEGAREAAVDGRYAHDTDAIVITAIDAKKVNIVLARGGKRIVKVGPYHGWNSEGDNTFEATVTRSANSQDYNVTGTLETNGQKHKFAGTLRGATGVFTGRLTLPNVDLVMEGRYNFDDPQFNLEYSLQGSFGTIPVVLKPGKLPAGSTLFGLVAKERGTIPGPSEHNNVKVWGDQQEKSFRLDMEMTSPYEGKAHINFEFSSSLTSTLKPGQEIDLTVLATADKSGRDAPNLSGTAFWLVEGDGAQVLEVSKAFVGTASDGKLYSSTTGVTKFKVLESGTIKITAVYVGQYWGSGGPYNWNPVTYTYEFKETAKEKIGG